MAASEIDKLPKCPLAGLQVAPISFGTVKIGRNIGVKNRVGDGVPLPADSVVLELLEICADMGVRLLDTAPAYGVAEKRLGSLLKQTSGEFKISTKVGERFEDGVSSYDFSAQSIQRSVEQSLRDLQRETLDVVLLHCPRDDLRTMRDSAALETLHRLRDQGKIQHLGASVHTVPGGEYAVQHGDVVMLPYNKGFRELEPVITKAQQSSCSVMAIKVLQQGHIDPAKDPVAACLEAVLTHSGINTAVIGSTNPVHLRANLKLALSLLGGSS